MASIPLFKRVIRVVIDTIEIKDLDMVFAIKKNLKPEPNTCDLKVYNLNPTNRSAIEQKGSAAVLIEAGYEQGTSILFLGDLRTSISVTAGEDIITALSCGDGEKKIRTSRINVAVKRQTKTTDVLKMVAKAIGVGDGNLTDAIKKLTANGVADIFVEGTVISGSASREMTAICRSLDLIWSVQDGRLQILPRKQALDGEAILLSPQTGLVGSPTIDKDRVLSARMLLIPDVFPGRKMVLDSARLKGQYRIEECAYSGDTSENDWYIDVKAKAY